MNENDPNNQDAEFQATLDMPAGVSAQQAEMPFAFVAGEPLTELPKDLYIPPDALEVFLEAFEGPLDLLLYLIKRQNLDILNIPIAEITKQYTSYIEMMEELHLELAAEYLVMAAMLAEIKSRMLLPRPVEDDMDESDPRAELIRRLQEYERFKTAAEDVDKLPRLERDTWQVSAEVTEKTVIKQEPQVDMKDLLLAFSAVLKRAEMFTHHHISRETLSVRQRMTNLLSVLDDQDFVEFSSLFTPEEGRAGVIVTLLAILELGKEHLLEIVQTQAFGQIYVKRAQMKSDEEIVISVDYADENDQSDEV